MASGTLQRIDGNPIHDASRNWRCRYFDAGNYRVSQITLCPYSEIHGGVRERIFREDGVQLVGLGFMRTEEAYEQSVRMTQAARAQQRAAGAA